jgi:hypothetical protein
MRQASGGRCVTRDSIRRVVPSELIRRINTLGRRCDWEEFSKVRQFEIVWSSGKPTRPEPYPTSRSAASWDQFLAELFEEWDGDWTKGRNLLIEIEKLRNRTWGAGRLRRKRRLRPVKICPKRSRTPLASTFPATSLFIKMVRSLERKIDERLRSSTRRIAASR